MPQEKVKYALRIDSQLQQEVKDWFPKDNCRSQNEFIEKIAREYFDFAYPDEQIYIDISGS